MAEENVKPGLHACQTALLDRVSQLSDLSCRYQNLLDVYTYETTPPAARTGSKPRPVSLRLVIDGLDEIDLQPAAVETLAAVTLVAMESQINKWGSELHELWREIHQLSGNGLAICDAAAAAMAGTG